MLVLTRKEGEKILIGDNITIVILSINGQKCRVGVDAPREIPVVREEVIKKSEHRQPDERDTLRFESWHGSTLAGS